MKFKNIKKYLIVLMAVAMVASLAVIPVSAANYAYNCSGCGQPCPVGRDYFGGLYSSSQGGLTYTHYYAFTSTSTIGEMCYVEATLFYLGVQCDFVSDTYVNGATAMTRNFAGEGVYFHGSCNQEHSVW